jgi:hypothetical protein
MESVESTAADCYGSRKGLDPDDSLKDAFFCTSKEMGIVDKSRIKNGFVRLLYQQKLN